MATVVDTALPPSRTTPDAVGDQRSSGFTAVNGRSPSHSLVNGREGRNGLEGQSGGVKSGSESEGEKRKGGPSSPESQSSMDYSPKRQRLSPARVGQSQAPSDPQSYSTDGKPTSMHSLSNGSATWEERSRNESANSEAHLAEALKTDMSGQPLHPPSTPQERGYQHGHSQHAPYHLTDPSDSPLDSPEAAALRQQHTGQQGQGRKRNFSNRTKTGCLTCRERKKKCDERKPFCSNCERGNFLCKGYTQASTSHKSSSVHPAQPTLQPQPHPQYTPYHPPAAGYYEHLPSHPQRQIPPPQEPHARSQYPAQSWAPSQQPHYQQEPMHQPSYQAIAAQPPQVPSQPVSGFPDPSRQSHHMPPPPQPVHPSHSRNNSQPYLYGSVHPAPFDDRQRTASLALSHASTNRASPSTGLTPSGRVPRTEKEKMLAGHPYQPRDAELKADRAVCIRSLNRFNKFATDPDNISDDSIYDKLRQVLQPPDAASGKKASSRSEKPSGHLGKNVEVQAPFQCEYGYNISIGDDVEIRRGCHIMDECPVEIGARTIIGPDVKILTLDGDHDDQRIRGHQTRLMRAKKVTIGEDCFIGANVIILPGHNIPNGATIGAGTIVTEDPPGPVVFVNGLPKRSTRSHWEKPQPRR